MRKPLKRLRIGQRVIVHTDAHGWLVGGHSGTVVRVRWRDDAAWVALDERSARSAAHPFEADDERGTWVLVYPAGCVRQTKRGKP